MAARCGCSATRRWCPRNTATVTLTGTWSRMDGTWSCPAGSGRASCPCASACRPRSSFWTSEPALPLPDDHLRAGLHAIVEVDHVDVAHADAAGRHGPADGLRLVGAVDAIQGVAVALVEIERAGAHRVARPAAHVLHVRPALLHLGGRVPIGPLGLAGDAGRAGPPERLLADGHGIAHSLAVRQHEIEFAPLGLDHDGAGLLAGPI